MKLRVAVLAQLTSMGLGSIVDRQLLAYAPIPTDAYTVPVPSGTTTVLSFIHNRPELSNLSALLEGVPGMIHINTTYLKVKVNALLSGE
jgi:hypothetical protein